MSRVIKSPYVFFDSNNKVELELISPVEPPPEFDDSEFTEISLADFEPVEVQSPEELAEEILSKARAEAEEIVNHARQEAQDIYNVNMQMINEKAKAIEQQSREMGREEGYNQGLAEAEGIKNDAEQVLQQAYAEREELINATEPQLVELIINIIGKLLPEIAELNPQVILNLIKQGLAGSSVVSEIVIHVSKDDYDYVADNKEAILMMLDTQSKLDVVMDLNLSKSDCIIETPFGNIDCSLDSQYSELIDSLYHILDHR